MYSTTMMRTSVPTMSKTGTAKAASRTALIVFGFLIGTGSNAATIVSERANSYAKPKQISQSPTRGAPKHDAIDLRNPMQHLENIKSVLNLPISETAAVFGVTRQSIYKWLAGASAPDQDNLAKIEELSRIADTFKYAGIERPSELVRMKVFEGLSILDLLKSGEPYHAHLPLLIEESKAMDLAYDNSKINKLAQDRTSDWKTTLSIPFSDDV